MNVFSASFNGLNTMAGDPASVPAPTLKAGDILLNLRTSADRMLGTWNGVFEQVVSVDGAIVQHQNGNWDGVPFVGVFAREST